MLKAVPEPTKEILAVLLWAGMIFSFSSVPTLATHLSQDWFLRKWAHVAEFGIFSFLLWRVLQRRPGDRGFLRLVAFLIAVLYAASDEVHQLFIPGREGTLLDVAIDSIGILPGVFIPEQKDHGRTRGRRRRTEYEKNLPV